MRKWRNLTGLGICGIFMIVSHQNCEAPPQLEEMGDAKVIENGSQPVSVIDEVKSDLALSFAAKRVEVHAEAEAINVEGLCSRNQEGAVLGWKAEESSTQSYEVSRGYAKCESGRFEIEMQARELRDCDTPYKVSARLGYGKAGEVVVSKRCPADGVSEAPKAKALLSVQNQNASCVIEKRDGRGTGCSVVCYSETGVVEAEREVDAQSCAL